MGDILDELSPEEREWENWDLRTFAIDELRLIFDVRFPPFLQRTNHLCGNDEIDQASAAEN